MKLYPILVFCLLSVLFFFSCRKDNSSPEKDLYGVWVNKNAPGDTLIFMNKNNKHILSINNSFNPTLPVRNELEYSFRDEKLTVNISMSSSAPVRQIPSFSWIEKNKVFQIKGFELYLFMSSSITVFVYEKIKN